MRHRSFPRHPHLPISVLGFGCMRLPILGGDMTRVDEDRAIPLIRSAIDRGVNYVDTAYPYHGGQSEVALGKALQDGYRAKVQVADKSPVWLVEQSSDWERLLDEQLQRLGTDHIDFYLLHALSAASWEKASRLGAIPAMEKALSDGRIKHLGFSFHDAPDAFTAILEGYAWDFCMIQHNFVDEGFQAGTAGLRRAAERGIGVIAMEPLRGGALAKAPAGIEAIWSRAGERRSPAQWALRWLWHRPEVVTVLSGMNTPEQLEENLAEANVAEPGHLTEAELALFEEARAWYHQRMEVPCTTCGYCEPCPEGVAIPGVFSQTNHASMFEEEAQAAWVYKTYVIGAGAGAERCTTCGTCLPACPQGIDIPARLAEAHRRLTTPR